MCLYSGETPLPLSSGDVADGMTGEGGVYRGAGEDTVLIVSTGNPVSWLSGVIVLSFSMLSGFEMSSGV